MDGRERIESAAPQPRSATPEPSDRLSALPFAGRLPDPRTLSPGAVLKLQRAAGNAAVAGALSAGRPDETSNGLGPPPNPLVLVEPAGGAGPPTTLTDPPGGGPPPPPDGARAPASGADGAGAPPAVATPAPGSSSGSAAAEGAGAPSAIGAAAPGSSAGAGGPMAGGAMDGAAGGAGDAAAAAQAQAHQAVVPPPPPDPAASAPPPAPPAVAPPPPPPAPEPALGGEMPAAPAGPTPVSSAAPAAAEAPDLGGGAAAEPTAVETVAAPVAFELPIPPPTAFDLPSAEGEGAQAIVDAMSSAAREGSDDLDAAVTEGVEAVGRAVAAHQSSVADAGTTAETGIRRQVADARTAVQGMVVVQRSLLAGAQAAQSGRLSAWFAGARTRTEQGTQTRAEQARTIATSAATDADSRVTGATTRARTDFGAAAGDAHRTGEDKAHSSAHEQTAEVHEARVGAARQVAGQTEQEINRALEETVQRLSGLSGQMRPGIVQQGEQGAQQIAGTAQASAANLQAAATHGEQAVAAALDTGLAALDAVQVGILRGLDDTQRELLNALRRQCQATASGVADLGHQTAAGLRERQVAAQAGAQIAVQRALAGAARQRVRRDAAGDVATTAGQAVREQYADAAGAARSQGGQLGGAVEGGASALIAEITAAADRAAETVERMRAEGATRATSAGESGVAGLTAAGDTTVTAGDDLVTQLLAALDSQLRLLEQGFTAGVGNFATQLGGSVEEAVGHAREPLHDLASRIDEAMARAGRDAERGWLESQWSNFVEMVSKPSFWVGLLVGLAVTVVAIALVGTMGPLGLAIVGAIAGSLAAGASTVTDNLLSTDPHRNWYTGVGQAMVIGAVSGAIGGALGGFGSQAVGAVFRVGAQEAAAMTATELAAVVANEQLAQRVVGTGLGTAQGIAMNVYNGDPWDRNLMANTAQGLAMSYLPNEQLAEGVRETAGIPEGGYGTPAAPAAPDAPRSAQEWLRAREATPPPDVAAGSTSDQAAPADQAPPAGAATDQAPPPGGAADQAPPAGAATDQAPPAGAAADQAPPAGAAADQVAGGEGSPGRRGTPGTRDGIPDSGPPTIDETTSPGGSPRDTIPDSGPPTIDETTSPRDTIPDSGSPRSTDDIPVIDLPEGSIMHGGNEAPLTAAEAQTMYDNAIADTPHREVAIFENTETGERIVIQGNESLTGAPPEVWAEFAAEQMGGGRWRGVKHNHPVSSETGVTPPHDRFPSGAGGDLAGAAAEGQASGQPHSESIDIVTENGPDQVHYGYDPTQERPYWVDVPGPGGTRTREQFRSMEAYHEWYEQQTGRELGTVGEGEPGTTGAPGDRGTPGDNGSGDGSGTTRDDEPPSSTGQATGDGTPPTGADEGRPPGDQTAQPGADLPQPAEETAPPSLNPTEQARTQAEQQLNAIDQRAAELLRRAQALAADESQPDYVRANAESVVEALNSTDAGMEGPGERTRRLRADLPAAGDPDEVRTFVSDEAARVAADLAALERTLPREQAPPAPTEPGPPAEAEPATPPARRPPDRPEPIERVRLPAERAEGRVLENPADPLPRTQRMAVDLFQEQFNELYRGGATEGDGGSAYAALREQAAGGLGKPPEDVVVEGTFHRDKSEQMARGLERMLNDPERGGRLPAGAQERVRFEIQKLREAVAWADAVRQGENRPLPRWARPWAADLDPTNPVR